jgi:hypothetical protein
MRAPNGEGGAEQIGMLQRRSGLTIAPEPWFSHH